MADFVPSIPAPEIPTAALPIPTASPPCLSFVSLAEVMQSAHEIREQHVQRGRQLAYNARVIFWNPAHKAALAEWKPMSMSQALKEAWHCAQLSARWMAIAASKDPKAQQLRELDRHIDNLNHKERWSQSDWAEMDGLRKERDEVANALGAWQPVAAPSQQVVNQLQVAGGVNG